MRRIRAGGIPAPPRLIQRRVKPLTSVTRAPGNNLFQKKFPYPERRQGAMPFRRLRRRSGPLPGFRRRDGSRLIPARLQPARPMPVMLSTSGEACRLIRT
jgi:hypothetical protein